LVIIIFISFGRANIVLHHILVFAALKYEAMLKECGGPGPTEDKMILVFKVLDQIIPHTGMFMKLMQMCRDEIFG